MSVSLNEPAGAPALSLDAASCASGAVKGLEPARAEAVAKLFKAVADPNRVRILSIISASPGAEACVCDLTEQLQLGQPTISHHLKIMVAAGLLHREKRGVWAHYSLVPGALEKLAGSVQELDVPAGYPQG
ncbi:metalloregulator ArsR/SmtB family transcription factor [Arthrobacter sp. Helios]|uniref:ArsR/SmtB family transcription factor n=1 Tax=Arthrobacter sp. Helios TaxID=2828862 RepID=UPI00205A4E28|nr:metalloregulator ArsR/SmtB family transcription factor [Arthrobacter sp. Helios]UPO78138.1 metalloregulator ArsR/SmtB family transcription factor [Arthrobacter sp. Helios]